MCWLSSDTLYGDITENKALQVCMQNPCTFVKSKLSKIEEQKETLKSCMCNHPFTRGNPRASQVQESQARGA